MSREEILDNIIENIPVVDEYQNILNCIIMQRIQNYAFNVFGEFIGGNALMMHRNVSYILDSIREKEKDFNAVNQQSFCIYQGNRSDHEEIISQFKESVCELKYLFLNTITIFEYNILLDGKQIKIWDMHTTPFGITEPQKYDELIQKMALDIVEPIELLQEKANRVLNGGFRIRTPEEKLLDEQEQENKKKQIGKEKQKIRQSLAEKYKEDLQILEQIGFPKYILRSPNEKLRSFLLLQNNRHIQNSGENLIISKVRNTPIFVGVSVKDMFFIKPQLLYKNPFI